MIPFLMGFSWSPIFPRPPTSEGSSCIWYVTVDNSCASREACVCTSTSAQGRSNVPVTGHMDCHHIDSICNNVIRCNKKSAEVKLLLDFSLFQCILNIV